MIEKTLKIIILALLFVVIYSCREENEEENIIHQEKELVSELKSFLEQKDKSVIQIIQDKGYSIAFHHIDSSAYEHYEFNCDTVWGLKYRIGVYDSIVIDASFIAQDYFNQNVRRTDSIFLSWEEKLQRFNLNDSLFAYVSSYNNSYYNTFSSRDSFLVNYKKYYSMIFQAQEKKSDNKIQGYVINWNNLKSYEAEVGFKLKH